MISVTSSRLSYIPTLTLTLLPSSRLLHLPDLSLPSSLNHLRSRPPDLGTRCFIGYISKKTISLLLVLQYEHTPYKDKLSISMGFEWEQKPVPFIILSITSYKHGLKQSTRGYAYRDFYSIYIVSAPGSFLLLLTSTFKNALVSWLTKTISTAVYL